MERIEVDVLIVGAGISGIGAACHLEMRRPGTASGVRLFRKGAVADKHLVFT